MTVLKTLFISENGPTEFTLKFLADSVKAKKFKKEVRIRKNLEKEEITTSLWNALASLENSNELALALEDVFV